MTCLNYASEKGPGVVGPLCAAGAAVEKADVDGLTPLCVPYPVPWLWLLMSEMLLAHHAQRTHREVCLTTTPCSSCVVCRYWASRYGHGGAVGALLAAGASVKVVNREGQTPLYWAARYGFEPIVDMLLAAKHAVRLRPIPSSEGALRAPVISCSLGCLGFVDMLLAAKHEVCLQPVPSSEGAHANEGSCDLLPSEMVRL